MNRIGLNLLVWSETLSDDLFPTIERLQELGYDGIEYPMGSAEEAMYQRLGSFLKERDLEATCVLSLGPEENPASKDAAVRERGLEKIKWTIDRAHDTGAEVICGPFHSAFSHFTQQRPQPEEYRRSAEVLHEAGEYAAQADVVLALEAINRFECYLCNTAEQLAGLIEEVDHPAVGATFDTHHANIEEKSLEQAIRRLAPNLAHVHISENDRGTPGDGHIPWEEVFGTLADVSYEGWYTIEAFTRSDPDFANAINVWRDFSEPWGIAAEGHAFIEEHLSTQGAR